MFRTAIAKLTPSLPAILLYVSSTSSLLVGVVAHSLGFIILARFLGTEQYGHLAAISAVTNLACPLCGLGASESMRRRVSRDPGLYRSILGYSLIVLGVTGFALVLTVSISLTHFIQIVPERSGNFVLILIFVSCNVVLYTWIVLVEQVLLAQSHFKRANIVNAGFGVARALTVIIACVGFGVDRLSDWVMWNAGMYTVVSLAGVAAIWSYGRPRWSLPREELSLGATMSGAGFLWALRQNVDILVLSSVEASTVVGAYSVARRVISTASTLGASLDRQIYSRLAIAGKVGPAATLRLALKFATYALLITVPASLALFIAAPFLPLIFGAGFSGSILTLRILCWTLVLGAIQNVAFDALNAADRHHARFVSGTAVGLLGAGLVAWFTYAYGISGAFVATYLSEAIIALTLWATLQILSKKQREPASSPQSAKLDHCP